MIEVAVAVIAALVIAVLFYLLGSCGQQAQVNQLKQRIADHEALTSRQLNEVHQEIGSLYKLIRDLDERFEAQSHKELAAIKRQFMDAGMTGPDQEERAYSPFLGGKL